MPYYYGYGFGIDPLYLLVVLVCTVLGLAAQSYINSTYKTWSRVRSDGDTGAAVARRMLDANGCNAVGIKGVAATNVTFPIGIIAAALALLIGDGCAANISLHLGRGEQEEADRTFANAVMLLFGVGILLSVFGCIFARQLVVFFGASPSVVAEAVLYMSIILSPPKQSAR